MFPRHTILDCMHTHVNDEGVIAQEKRLKRLSIYCGVVRSARKNELRSETKPSALEIFAVINNFVHVCTL